MQSFAGKIAAVTGGGTGIGRELARALAAEGCSVAICDVSVEAMVETKRLCLDNAPKGTSVSTFCADVAVEEQMMAWADAVRSDLATEEIHLLFNNAGIGGGGSFVAGGRSEWERTFAICFYGVINGVRAFLPLLKNASEARIVNTSSINGFWASLGHGRPHTAYSTAKFAVKGFTESLIEDLAVNAPHIGCSLVMPGHVATEIAANSMRLQAAHARRREPSAVDNSGVDEIRIAGIAARFQAKAPMSAAQAARVILDGVRAGRWRILVGKDAEFLDECVRSDPENAYTEDFSKMLRDSGHLALL